MVCGSGIRLPKIGIVKAKLHRLPREDWIIRSATVSQDPDGYYYVSVLFEYEAAVPDIKPDLEKAIGFDYKSDNLYADSMGHVAGSPKFYHKSQEKLAKAQRSLSKKQRGSKGYEKQRVKVASVHKHIANQRLDFLHKLSTEIANRYDVVCVEDLDMKAMSNKGFGLDKATMDNGYGEFLWMLEYKLVERGKHLIRVSRWYPSSQTCSSCGRSLWRVGGEHPNPNASRWTLWENCLSGMIITAMVEAGRSPHFYKWRVVHLYLVEASSNYGAFIIQQITHCVFLRTALSNALSTPGRGANNIIFFVTTIKLSENIHLVQHGRRIHHE